MPPIETSSATGLAGRSCGGGSWCYGGSARLLGTLVSHLDRLALDVQIACRLGAVVTEVVGIAIDRVAAPVEAKRLLLEVQLLGLGPRRHVGKRHRRRPCALVRAAEQVEIALAEFLVPLGARAVIAGAVDGRKQPGPDQGDRIPQHRVRAAADERVAGARFHQRLEHPLVGQPQVENLAERMQRRDAAAELRARVDDRLDRALAEALDRGQPEPDSMARLDGEMQLALVDVRRQHGNRAIAALGEIHGELVGVLRLDGQERGGKVPRVVRLEICGLVGEEGVGGGMRLVEAVSRRSTPSGRRSSPLSSR